MTSGRNLGFGLGLLIALLSPRVLAETDPAVGEALYTPCASCHGDNAQGNAALQAPRLNHLKSVYLSRQLEKFRSGLRGGRGAQGSAVQMAAMAATLADEQAVLEVATYIAGLDSDPSAVTVQGDIGLGADYYNQYCGSCHGRGAGGNVALNSPRLAGADDWYLLAQMQAFRGGTRGSQKQDKTGRQMRVMAAALPSEQAVVDVVAYIRSLEP